MIDNHRDLLGALGLSFSHIRGVETGLSPTEADLNCLETIVCKSKELRFKCEIGTLQPKWQLIFDGHSLLHIQLPGGLADKTDDMIELAHQPWKREKERTRNTRDYEMQQKSQLEGS